MAHQVLGDAIHAPMTLESFLSRNWETGDGLKYEWRDGMVEAGEERMKLSEAGIINRLVRRFVETTHYREGANLLQELEVNFPGSKSYRIPDFSVLTKDQIDAADGGDATIIPAFVIEVISPNDLASHLDLKLKEYFASGVQVVWHIIPDLKWVRVFHGGLKITQFSDDGVCSAAPAFPDFSIKVSEIFA